MYIQGLNTLINAIPNGPTPPAVGEDVNQCIASCPAGTYSDVN